jgi:Ca2+-binding RTX toxin-like protein
MFRRSVRFALALAAAAATTSIATAAHADPITEITPTSNIEIVPLKNAAMIEKTQWGYRYTSGQQNGHLTVTMVDGKLLYTDTGTQELRKRPKSCTEQTVDVGIQVLCRVPARFADASQMFLEIWPRLGNDYTNGATLPAKFRMWVLADTGDDTFFGGAGDDFFNGGRGTDETHGGDGADWIRTGLDDDTIFGDGGSDLLVATDGTDVVHGGSGDDKMYGGTGNDRLFADGGKDSLQCAGGSDSAYADSDDRTSQCEDVIRS